MSHRCSESRMVSGRWSAGRTLQAVRRSSYRGAAPAGTGDARSPGGRSARSSCTATAAKSRRHRRSRRPAAPPGSRLRAGVADVSQFAAAGVFGDSRAEQFSRHHPPGRASARPGCPALHAGGARVRRSRTPTASAARRSLDDFVAPSSGGLSARSTPPTARWNEPFGGRKRPRRDAVGRAGRPGTRSAHACYQAGVRRLAMSWAATGRLEHDRRLPGAAGEQFAAGVDQAYLPAAPFAEPAGSGPRKDRIAATGAMSPLGGPAKISYRWAAAPVATCRQQVLPKLAERGERRRTGWSEISS